MQKWTANDVRLLLESPIGVVVSQSYISRCRNISLLVMMEEPQNGGRLSSRQRSLCVLKYEVLVSEHQLGKDEVWCIRCC